MDARPFAASYDDATSTLSLSGIVDELSIDEMRVAVEAATADGAPVVIDLGEVDFLPSIALGVLALALRNARTAGGEVRLVARSGSLAQRVLEVSGLPFASSA